MTPGSRPAPPRSAGLHSSFEEWAAREPDRIAAVLGGRAIRYGELNARANGIASLVDSGNAGRQEVVAVLFERSFELLAAMLGVLKAGAACLCLDPADPPRRVKAILADAGARTVLTADHLADGLPAGRWKPLVPSERIPAAPRTRRPIAPDSLAFVFYTSGSTGEPKGVALTHGARANRLRWECAAYGVGSSDAILMKSSAGFARIVKESLWPLSSGARAVIAPPRTQLDLPYLIRLMVSNRVSVAIMVPGQIDLLSDEPDAAKLSLRLLLNEGEPLPTRIARRFCDRFRIHLINAYGLTEVSTVAVTSATGEDEGAFVPIGFPAGLPAYVVDENLRPVPAGSVGELLIGGIGLAREYLNRPELTAQRFIPDHLGDPRGRLFRTGDRARQLPDGRLEHMGRLDALLKIRGFRVEPGEVEQALTRHRGIREAAVALRSPGGEVALVAYLVATAGDTMPTRELTDFLAESLPPHAIPSRFVWLPDLPRTPNGKVAYSELPEPGVARDDHDFAAPVDDVECRLAAIWAQVLGVDRVGATDDFFEHGGHSFLAARVFAEIAETFGRRLPLATIFLAPTVRQLAHRLRPNAEPTSLRPLVTIKEGEVQTPFFCVHGLYGNVLCFRELARRLDAGRAFHALQAVGLGTPEPPLDRVETMAQRYIEEVISLQPAGPYLLGGYSFGGMVAWEMAQRLISLGADVAVLCLIDAVAPHIHQFVPPFPYTVYVRIGDRTDGEVVALDRLVSGFGKPDGVEAWSLRPVARDARYIEVERGTTAATRTYRPLPYRGRVTILCTETSRRRADASLGWRSLVLGPLTIDDVPGDHLTLLSPPWVEVVARKLEIRLSEALAEYMASGG